MISSLVSNTLVGLGIDVIRLRLSTTPTVEVAVPLEKADGGIIVTASHNPKQWNALKLLNEAGEFLNAAEGKYYFRNMPLLRILNMRKLMIWVFIRRIKTISKSISMRCLTCPLLMLKAIRKQVLKLL